MKLKPCPKCGGEAMFSHIKDLYDESYRKYSVFCIEKYNGNCDVEIGRYDTKEEAMKAWNKL